MRRLVSTLIFLLTVLIVVFLYITPVFAHPGRTAADGCHYCRTNCDKWGVPWNQRHCHGGYIPPKTYVLPTNTPTLKPLPTNTPLPTPTETPTPTPTINESSVLGETKENSELSGTSILGVLAGFAGFVIIFWRAINQKWPFNPKELVSKEKGGS